LLTRFVSGRKNQVIPERKVPAGQKQKGKNGSA